MVAFSSSFTRLLALLPFALTSVVDAAFVDTTFVVANQVISPDGFPRSAALMNGIFPGTVIFANKGDILRNTVVNQLTDPNMRRSTSIHWHGLFQFQTAQEDGPAFVTQCPIAPGLTYTYVIPLRDQEGGTHWYHSHLGSQYIDGVRGGIVVYDPEDPHLSLYDVDNAETVIQMSDWYHQFATVLSNKYLFDDGKEPAVDSGLINGKGRYKGGPAVPYAVIPVVQGKRYRFRLINNNGMGFFTFEIDGHPFTVIEADGVSHDPIPNLKSLIIHPAQRYSVVVNANQPIGNYWIRAPLDPKEKSKVFDAELVKAVLRYEGAPDAEPTTSKTSGNKLDHADLHPTINPGAPGGNARADFIVDLKFGGGKLFKAAWQINDITYEPPSLPTLLKILANNATTNADFERKEHTIVLPFDKVIELRIAGSSQGFQHPFHLHGHAFDVITDGNGPENYVNPPRRDVVAVGGSGAIIRFRSDNPGPWFLHCHIDWHLEAGLAVVFAEAPSEQRATIAPSPGWQQLCPTYAALPLSQQ